MYESTRGGAIHNVLVIAEKEPFGACLEAVLRKHAYNVTIEEFYGRFSDVLHDIVRTTLDLVIVTNTSLTPIHIRNIIPDIKARHSQVRIMVLSGYHSESFVADLGEKGMDVFLPIPYDEDVLLKEVEGLLSKPIL